MPVAFWPPLAHADLDHLWDYIAEDSPAAADRFLARLEKK
jgi:plasmid stabilization system protein ParE